MSNDIPWPWHGLQPLDPGRTMCSRFLRRSTRHLPAGSLTSSSWSVALPAHTHSIQCYNSHISIFLDICGQPWPKRLEKQVWDWKLTGFSPLSGKCVTEGVNEQHFPFRLHWTRQVTPNRSLSDVASHCSWCVCAHFSGAWMRSLHGLINRRE